MADINAQNLTAETLSTLDGTENVVAFDTATGKRIPLTVLGDYVIQKLVGSATLAGSAQTVKAAIDAVFNTADNVNTNSYMELGTSITKNSDLNEFITFGKYSAGSSVAATLTHCPTSVGFSMYVERFTSAGKKQILIDNNGDTFYRTNISANTSSWRDWRKYTTEAIV